MKDASDKFKSKSGFILSSIGAAVGLGNALRFPGLCAKYGGGAFLLIYFAALIILGIPLLNAEIALGRRYGGGSPRCMGALARKFSKPAAAVGWAACFNSVITAVIYAGLAGWIIATAAHIAPLAVRAPELSRSQISDYFFAQVLKSRNDGIIDGVSPLVLGCILAAWAVMYFCVRGGAGTLSKAAKFTVVIPVALLVLLAGRGMLYQTAPQALQALFLPDFSALSRPDLWLTALGQVFFSLSIVVGIMPVYGSYLPAKSNIFTGALAVAAADFGVSVLASVVLFTTLYGCGLQNAIGASGIITAFAVYPVAITRLFGAYTALNAIVGVLFYSSLAMMAIQSAVSMLEAFISPFVTERGADKKKTVIYICVIGGIISAVFATTAAPLIAEVADNFVNFYNVLALGIAETLILSRSRVTETLTDEINKYSKKLKLPKAAFCVSVKYLSPAVLICLCVMEVYRVICSPLAYPAWVIFAFGAGLSITVFVCGIWLSYKPPFKTPRDRRRRLKKHLNTAIFGRFWRKRVKK